MLLAEGRCRIKTTCKRQMATVHLFLRTEINHSETIHMRLSRLTDKPALSMEAEAHLPQVATDLEMEGLAAEAE
ncbi:hypothetical protein, partial [Oerskovia enterophila]